MNAIPSPSSGASQSSSQHRYSSSNRYINQSDLCTKIISGNYKPAVIRSLNSHQVKVEASAKGGSFSSSSSTSSSSESSNSANGCVQQNQNHHNHTSACCEVENSKLAAERSAIDNSMRCTLRRGRPNTPKSGLSVDYRIRKSSVPNTPECAAANSNRVNHTIGNDDFKLISEDQLKKT